MDPPKTDEAGQMYYDHVPEGFRLATMGDYNKGLFKNNTPYLIYGHRTGVYYPLRVRIMLPQAVLGYIQHDIVYIYTGS